MTHHDTQHAHNCSNPCDNQASVSKLRMIARCSLHSTPLLPHDHKTLCAVQYNFFNIVSVLLCCGIILVQPSKQLHAVKPPAALMSPAVLAPLAFFIVYCAVMETIATMMLRKESWYTADFPDRVSIIVGMQMLCLSLCGNAIEKVMRWDLVCATLDTAQHTWQPLA